MSSKKKAARPSQAQQLKELRAEVRLLKREITALRKRLTPKAPANGPVAAFVRARGRMPLLGERVPA